MNKVLRIFGFVFVSTALREYRANNAKNGVKLTLSAPYEETPGCHMFPWWIARLEIRHGQGDNLATMQLKFASTHSPARALDGLLKAAARFGARLRDEADREDGIRGTFALAPIRPSTKLLVGDTYPIRKELRRMGGEWDADLRGWQIPIARWAEALRLRRNNDAERLRARQSHVGGRGYAICYSAGRDGEEIIRDATTNRRLTRAEAADIIRRGGKSAA